MCLVAMAAASGPTRTAAISLGVDTPASSTAYAIRDRRSTARLTVSGALRETWLVSRSRR